MYLIKLFIHQVHIQNRTNSVRVKLNTGNEKEKKKKKE